MQSTVGHSAEEYFAISLKEGLPKRCPILRNCQKAVWTRYILGFCITGTNESFEDFISSSGQYWKPEKMIQQIEQMEWTPGPGTSFYANKVCPEITLFEEEFLPFCLVPSACGYVSYNDEFKKREAIAKHYSECAEFSEYQFQNLQKIKTKNKSIKQIPEKELEDYLGTHLEVLESGLTLVKKQKALGKWKVDILALDSSGSEVIIELKTKPLNSGDIDKLIGQVSRYYNHFKLKSNNLRLFIIVPRNNELINNIYHGLKSWIDESTATIFQFDYTMYSKEFIFSKAFFT